MKIPKSQQSPASKVKRPATKAASKNFVTAKGSKRSTVAAFATSPRGGKSYFKVAVSGAVAPKTETRKIKPSTGRPRSVILGVRATQARAAAEWEAKLHASEDVLEMMLDEAEALCAERDARKAHKLALKAA